MVYVHVKPEHFCDFMESIRVNHERSIKEPGNVRFDILQSVDDPTRFLAYEAYVDEASAKAHKETAHYLAWRDEVAGWMARAAPGRPVRRPLPGGPGHAGPNGRVGRRRRRRWNRKDRRRPENARARARPRRCRLWPGFSIARLPRIVFGGGASAQLGGVVREFGRKALVVVRGPGFTESQDWARLRAALETAGVDVAVETVSGEPSPTLVDGIVARHRVGGRVGGPESRPGSGPGVGPAPVDVVVGIGGGSASTRPRPSPAS